MLSSCAMATCSTLPSGTSLSLSLSLPRGRPGAVAVVRTSCAKRLFEQDGAQGLLEQLSTAASGVKSPFHSSWKREVLQFTACMLPDNDSKDTDCKQATFTDFCSAVLECDDGTGACCELVQDFLKERGSCGAVEQMLRDKMQEIRGTDLLVAGLCHPSQRCAR